MERPERCFTKPRRERLEGEAYRALTERVYARDGWRCRNPFCGSSRNLTPHHLKKRSQLGGDVMSNLITLCVVCHDRVEENKLAIEVVAVTENDVSVKFFNRGGHENPGGV